MTLRRWLPPVVAALAFAAGGLCFHARSPLRGHAEREAQLFERLRRTVERSYVDSLPAGAAYEAAARGLLAELHDPYAELLVGEEYHAYMDQMGGSAVGVGFAPAGGTAATPAQPGAHGVSAEARGGRGGGTADATALVPPGRRGRVLAPAVGYVRLSAITEHSADELREAVDGLVARGTRGLVLDLRSNTGGLIAQGVAVAELFLSPGDTVAVVEGRSAENSRVWIARGRQRWPRLAVAVLVNRNTASAAELVAAALQDHRRAVLVGSRTYGKGVVQTTFPLGPDAAVKFTTARWLSPRGRFVGYGRATGAAEWASGSDTARGLAPDVVALPRVRSRGERALLDALGGDLGLIDAAVDSVARAALDTTAGSERPHRAELREAVARRLADQGLSVAPEVLATATPFLDRQLATALRRAERGDSRLVRHAGDDRQLETALLVLRRRNPGLR